jgi:uncharacterized LabA/DUF88 family protein
LRDFGTVYIPWCSFGDARKPSERAVETACFDGPFFIPEGIGERNVLSSKGFTSMSRIANFIDGAYLQFVLREEFGSPKIDFGRLAQKVADGREILRTYFYDCLPYQSQNPTQEERERFGKKQRFFAALEKNPRFQVRQGRLEFRGKDSKGAPIFEQKRVDILMGVDLALLAAKHQITDAAIIAGDSDFLPAIEAAKTEGVVIHLFHGLYPHRDLVTACDERTRIEQPFIDSILMT